MQTLSDLPALRAARAALTGRVAFVPTMGALHAGHLALVEEARAGAEHVVVSIFVNPLQFGANEDLGRYPRTEEADAALLRHAGVDLLWLPPVAVMYPADFATSVSVAGVSAGLEGAYRPGHFDGVATVVLKLLNQVRPDLAVFGEKDWQQLAVVRRMVADLDLPIDIVGLLTVREADGLALSSRNRYLSHDERQRAVAFPRALQAAAGRIERGEAVHDALRQARAAIQAAGFEVDYVAAVDRELRPTETEPVRLVAAAKLGTTRLIDNLPVGALTFP